MRLPQWVFISAFGSHPVEPASLQSLQVMLVNDEDRQVEGTLTLALENSRGERVDNQTKKFAIAPLGQNTVTPIQVHKHNGDFLLRAIIEYRANGEGVSTQSRRLRQGHCSERKGKLTA